MLSADGLVLSRQRRYGAEFGRWRFAVDRSVLHLPADHLQLTLNLEWLAREMSSVSGRRRRGAMPGKINNCKGGVHEAF